MRDGPVFGRRVMEVARLFVDTARRQRKTVNRRAPGVVAAAVLMMCALGCRSTGLTLGLDSRPVHRVVCLYDASPWLNLDRSGDLDPEGFSFRVFLDAGTGRGEKLPGTLHVEMYRLERVPGVKRKQRTLVSDWHYPIDEMPQIAKPGMLGEGYYPQLAWADKNLAGSEVDVVVSFEDTEGNVVRAPTKRLKIPRYEH